ncbi:IpaD/SipD/SspD family type III secretion system needle tip protein [Pseudomonas fluorescens]|uniref:IpaD/SipD/SspD family type III secretion system needle tip protein n=1 Tax=Pseudomonas fluorescens TaxID=294 RepID=UPI003525BCA0
MRIVDFTPPASHQAADAPPAAVIPTPGELPRMPQAAQPLVQLLDRSNKGVERQLDNLLKVQPPAQKLAEQLLAGTGSDALRAEFGGQLQSKRVRAQMWAQQVRQSGAVMAQVQQSLPAQQQQSLIAAQQNLLAQIQRSPAPPEGIASDLTQPRNGTSDFFDKLQELIGLIKNSYLAGYQHIIEVFTGFFDAFNKDITARMEGWIKGVKDGKQVKLSVGELRSALQALVKRYSHPQPAAVLFPAPGMGAATRDEASKWLKALGLPDDSLKRNANGSYSVVMDLSPLTIMIGQLPSKGSSVEWDTARFQSWQTGFNAQEERLKNRLQSFTQKYSNANAYHDNFNKVLSSHLNQYTDMLKAMLHF